MSKAEQPAGDNKTKKGRTGFLVIIIVLVVILVAVVGMGVMKKMGGSEEGKPGGPEVPSEEIVYAVNTTSAVEGPISDYFQINGEVEATSSVDTYSDAAGILARLYVGLGDYVRKDQIIAEIDPSRPGLNYSLSPVKARVSGTITSLPLDQGDAVSQQIPVATIGDLSRLQVVSAIPERFISRIYVGMPAEVTLEAWPGHVITMQVTQVDPVVDPASRTMEIIMEFPTGQVKAKAGMYADIRLTTDEKEQVVKIPADTVLRRLGETFVFVINEDKAEKRIVVPGITLDGVVEIVEGLAAGEKVAYQGQTLLEDGVAVRVIRDVRVIEK